MNLGPNEKSKRSGEEMNVNYENFLNRHDMIWNQMPKNEYQGPFMGNGILGGIVHEIDEGLAMMMGHSYVYDHRMEKALDYLENPANGLFYNCRLPIGHMLLSPKGKYGGNKPEGENQDIIDIRLDLFKAKTIYSFGEKSSDVVELRVHAEKPLFMISGTVESIADIEFLPALAQSPRQTYGELVGDETKIRTDYEANPPAYHMEEDGLQLCVQPLLSGWYTITARKKVIQGDKAICYATIAHQPGFEETLTEVNKTLSEVTFDDFSTLVIEHERWWDSYYRASFFSVNDTAMESFYWIQVYKLACATRFDGPVIDNQGPWCPTATPWPQIWWNLNVQLSYSPVFKLNHGELFQSVNRSLIKHKQNLIANAKYADIKGAMSLATYSDYQLNSMTKAPGKYEANLLEIGNLIWVMHSCWQYYLSYGNEEYLLNFFFPMLKNAVNYSLSFVDKIDGVYHVQATMSPEYGEMAMDTNYEVALIRWGVETLLTIDRKYNISDEQKEFWQDINDNLVAYPVGETGYLIGKDLPYAYSHRHYSHLMMAFPLYLVDLTDPKEQALLAKSIAHWQSYPEYLEGYSCTGAASLYASIGKGDMALESFRGLWRGFLHPNTLYKEMGPVIETPLSGVRTIQDMILQDWGDTVRVFPAVPKEWADIEIADWRVAGKFLVSARLRDGNLDFIKVSSLEGGVLKILFNDKVQEFLFSQGEERVLFLRQETISTVPLAVKADQSKMNTYGMR